jgi:hypothetical protein
MAQPNPVLDTQQLERVLGNLAEELAGWSQQFGSIPSTAALADEIANLRKLVQRGRAELNASVDRASAALDDLLEAMSRLAAEAIQAGAFTVAASLDGHVLATRRAQLGARHPQVAVALRNRTRDYFHTGDYAAAARFGEEALSLMSEALGNDVPYGPHAFPPSRGRRNRCRGQCHRQCAMW